MTDAARRVVHPCSTLEVLELPTVLSPALQRIRPDGSDEGFAVLAGGGDDGVIEGGPVSVIDGVGVAAGGVPPPYTFHLREMYCYSRVSA